MRCQWYLKNFNKVWAPPCGFYIHTKNRAVSCVWRTKPRINYIQGGGVKQNINMETHYFHSFRNDMFFSVSFFITFATTISKSSSVTSTLLSLRANIPDSVHTACSKQNKRKKEEGIIWLCTEKTHNLSLLKTLIAQCNRSLWN